MHWHLSLRWSINAWAINLKWCQSSPLHLLIQLTLVPLLYIKQFNGCWWGKKEWHIYDVGTATIVTCQLKVNYFRLGGKKPTSLQNNLFIIYRALKAPFNMECCHSGGRRFGKGADKPVKEHLILYVCFIHKQIGMWRLVSSSCFSNLILPSSNI